MLNAVQVLIGSFGVVLFLFVIAVVRVTFLGYASTFGDGQFAYKFDKTRLLFWGYTELVILAICFIYAVIISHQVGDAIGFCIIVLPFSLLGSLIYVCLVPREPRNRPSAKLS